MMKNHDCVTFLQWALPQLHLRWRGMRKVRGQVCKRIQRRLRELTLPNISAYQVYLTNHPEEWAVLDEFCRITISRFYRDRAVFNYLQQVILPDLAQQSRVQNNATLRCWSAGCASGEEAYTLQILWQLALSPQLPDLSFQVIATDINAHLLERAQVGCYEFSSIKELPTNWITQAFDQRDEQYWVKSQFRAGLNFYQQDIRSQMSEGLFHLILCRNFVFTYFDFDRQREMVNRFAQNLWPGGVLLIGKHETLPSESPQFEPIQGKLGIYGRHTLTV